MKRLASRPVIFVALVFLFLLGASSVAPSIGLYWFSTTDPTAGAGVSAPANQLLIRTDTPSLYYKAGASNTAWTQLGLGGGSISVTTSGNIQGNGQPGTPVTTTTNQSIPGTLDVTGPIGGNTQAIIAPAGLQVNTASGTAKTPKLKSYDGNPNGIVTADKGSLLMDTSTPAIWQNTTGGTVWFQGTNGQSSTLSGVIGANASTNFSTLGTIDWLWAGGTSSSSSVTASPNHFKLDGINSVRQSWTWIGSGFVSSTTKVAPQTYSTTASDDAFGVAVSSTQVSGFANAGTIFGYGFSFAIPARSTTQVIRIYTNQFNNAATLTATMSDGSATPITLSNSSAASSDSDVSWIVTFKGQGINGQGAYLLVKLLVTGRIAAVNHNFFCGGVSVGSS